MKTISHFTKAFKGILMAFGMSIITIGTTASQDNLPLKVYTVNYPLAYFTDRIGGSEVIVVFEAPNDIDPAYWKPSSEQIAGFQKADLILLNGASYAKWVAYVSLPASRTVNTSASFKNDFIPLENTVSHSHGSEGNHQHGDVAFTTWLDPLLAIKQSTAIKDALIRLLPNSTEAISRRYESLLVDLIALDEEIEAVVRIDTSKTFVFSHPVYQYFIHRYSLKAKEIHWEPDEFPTDDQWVEFNQLLKDFRTKWMIWEGEPATATKEKLKESEVNCTTFSPCGNKPEKGDYLSVMGENVKQLKEAFTN